MQELQKAGVTVRTQASVLAVDPNSLALKVRASSFLSLCDEAPMQSSTLGLVDRDPVCLARAAEGGVTVRTQASVLAVEANSRSQGAHLTFF